MQPEIHAPFNKNCNGNQGYLFVIYQKMVDFVINNSLSKVMPKRERAGMEAISKMSQERFELEK